MIGKLFAKAIAYLNDHNHGDGDGDGDDGSADIAYVSYDLLAALENKDNVVGDVSHMVESLESLSYFRAL